MIARYAGGEKGARAAAREGAAVVVVDAYRASTTIAVLVHKGARVVPVASIEEAAGYPGADFRIGERGSAKVQGFDFGNSPTEVQAAQMKPGSTVALSTTNGTRVTEAADGSPAIFSGAFVNARAVAEALKDGAHGPRVVVVGCGWEGHRSSEDEAAAGAILSHLFGAGAELDERAERVVDLYRRSSKDVLAKNTAAKRLLRLGYEKDLGFCLAEDAVPVVPRLVEGAFVEDGSAPGLAGGPTRGPKNTQICSQN